MSELMTEVLQVLVDLWKYDIAVMSNHWMYWPLMIPIIGYAVFFLFKWWLITAPIWLPARLLWLAFWASVGRAMREVKAEKEQTK